MIYIGENKSILCKGDFRPAQLYRGDKKITGYELTAFEGTGSVTLENCYNDKIYDAKLHSKNLLDVNSIYPDFANDEGGITYSNKEFAKIISISMMSDWKENTQYTFSADYEVAGVGGVFAFISVSYTDGTSENFRYCFGGDVISEKGNCSISTKSQKTVSRAILTYSGTRNNEYSIKLTNMQLEEGSAATEYESPLTDATITVKSMENTEKSQTVLFENGEPTDDIPTFKGTTIIEIESDAEATISGKYKKMEE